MLIEITLKDPDGFHEGIKDAAKESVLGLAGLSLDEIEKVQEDREQSFAEALEKWVEYGEYVTLIYDTEARTLTVKELEGDE